MENIVKSVEYGYSERKKLIDKLCEKYGFLKRSVIGRSCAGRDITALKIGTANEYSLIAAAFHGSEGITATVLLMLIEELSDALKYGKSIANINITRGLQGRGAVFVPCVNPDGCEISLCGAAACGEWTKKLSRLCKNDFKHWNSNLRGVDINHNFDAGWKQLKQRELDAGKYGPAPTRYGGERPESEPETVALTELCRAGKIRQALALHSQGEVIYRNFAGIIPPRSKKMSEIMATASGYALKTADGLAEGGGFKDWFISEFNRPAFTVELGKGKNPLPAEDATEIYNRIKEMLVLFLIM